MIFHVFLFSCQKILNDYNTKNIFYKFFNGNQSKIDADKYIF